ncbi:MAG: quinolinate synthase NadA [Labilithrix sp.]|nr:quinolinate synthase NadA [Labilithrix sp.]MCW5818037.1 quinolinate synthase NadA [Labilithrix sp.]
MRSLPIAGRAAPRPIDPSLDLEDEIAKLKKEKNAVILAHYYQDSDIQDVADFIGDSLQLAQAAAKTQADVICFAGVHFMAETAKILNPDKIVVVPDMEAGCSLASGAPAAKVAAWKARFPGAVLASYINCSAEVKALSDYIVTSSNAEKIVSKIPEGKPILFAPDKNLGGWINKKLGKRMELWPGTCIVHDTFSERKIIALEARHPNALLLAHPECDDVILKMADYIGSTTGILNYATKSDAKSFIVATEPGILHQMQKAAPDKEFIPAPPEASCACNECPHMKKNTLEKVYLALRDLEPRLEMDPALMKAALVPLNRMLELSA